MSHLSKQRLYSLERCLNAVSTTKAKLSERQNLQTKGFFCLPQVLFFGGFFDSKKVTINNAQLVLASAASLIK